MALGAHLHVGITPLTARRVRSTHTGARVRVVASAVTTTVDPSSAVPSFHAAPFSHFDMTQLELKGPRSNVDVGDPHDYGRPFVKGALDGNAACGSWACTPGGWDSPNARPSTEWFYVLSGNGSVSDPDGTPHPFGPGDVVVLSKGWYGRWDITEHIHKIWLTHAHDDKEGASKRPVVKPFSELVEGITSPTPGGNRFGAAAYDVSGFRAGAWVLPAHGVCDVANDGNTCEVNFVVEGEVFVVDGDGAVARRCVAGDTVFMPQGWRGSVLGGAVETKVAAVAVSGGTVSSGGSSPVASYNAPVASYGQTVLGAERDEMYDPENERRGR